MTNTTKPPATGRACALLEACLQAADKHARASERLVLSAMEPGTTRAGLEALRRESVAALHTRMEAERALLAYIAETEAAAR